MKKNNFLLLLLVLLCITSKEIKAQQSVKIVEILNHIGGEEYSVGTGFLLADNGMLITCYHVIQNARELEIRYDGTDGKRHRSQTVQVYGINLDFDLAKLYCAELSGLAGQINTEPNKVMIGEASVLSFPRNYDNFEIPGHVVVDHFSPALNYMLNNNHIFTSNIDLLMLDINTQPGMSGGPVVQGGKVTGVFEGGISNGGTIAWAIPVKYLSLAMSQPIGTIAQQTSAPLNLINPEFQDALKSYITIATDIQNLTNELANDNIGFRHFQDTVPIISERGRQLIDQIDNFISFLNQCKTNRTIDDNKNSEYVGNIMTQFNLWFTPLKSLTGNLKPLVHDVAFIFNGYADTVNLSKKPPAFRTTLQSFHQQLDLTDNIFVKFVALTDNEDQLLADYQKARANYQSSPSDQNRELYLDSFDKFFSCIKQVALLLNQNNLNQMAAFPDMSLEMMLKLFNG